MGFVQSPIKLSGPEFNIKSLPFGRDVLSTGITLCVQFGVQDRSEVRSIYRSQVLRKYFEEAEAGLAMKPGIL